MTTRITLDQKLSTEFSTVLEEDIRLIDGSIIVDAKKVRFVGALCAQILFRDYRRRIMAGYDWTLEPSDQVKADLDLLGMKVLFEGGVERK